MDVFITIVLMSWLDLAQWTRWELSIEDEDSNNDVMMHVSQKWYNVTNIKCIKSVLILKF